jgi:hypothetical protein
MARLVALWGLLLVVPALTGCGMCQNCQDVTGPVMQAPNQGDYYNSPRVNSGVSGAPVMEGTIEGEGIPMEASKQPAQLNR